MAFSITTICIFQLIVRSQQSAIKDGDISSRATGPMDTINIAVQETVRADRSEANDELVL